MIDIIQISSKIDDLFVTYCHTDFTNEVTEFILIIFFLYFRIKSAMVHPNSADTRNNNSLEK